MPDNRLVADSVAGLRRGTTLAHGAIMVMMPSAVAVRWLPG